MPLRSASVVLATYMLGRLALLIVVDPTAVPDTAGYSAISLTGSASRPWVLPLMFAVTSDWTFVILQTVVSACAFFVFAIVVARTFNDVRVRAAFIAVVLLLGFDPRITAYDGALVSESLAVSFTLLLIAAGVSTGRLHGAAIVALFVAWTFVRDSHAILGPIAVALLTAPLIRERRWVVAVSLLVVTAWGLFALQNNDEIEASNVTRNVAFQISYDQERFAWFLDQGMPDVVAFDIIDPPGRLRSLEADGEFQAWARTDGVGKYVSFLIVRPGFTFGALPSIFVNDSLTNESMADEPLVLPTEPPAGLLGWFWPANGTVYSSVLAASALAVVWPLRRDRRVVAPALLALTTVPHALLVYHGAPTELARHALMMTVVLVFSCWWLIALAADTFLTRAADAARRQDSPVNSRIVTCPSAATPSRRNAV